MKFIAGVAGFAAWGLTLFGLIGQGQSLLWVLLTFFCPPAVLGTAWLVSPVLGVLGLVAIAAGVAHTSMEDRRRNQFEEEVMREVIRERETRA